MKHSEILKRLTGFSSPVFGLSWNPPESEQPVAKRVIAQLEDRRVLYNPYSLEVPGHCIESVIEIRRALSGELGGLDENSLLAKSLRAMRGASRKFLDRASPGGPSDRQSHFPRWGFELELGELRGVFGVHIAQVAAQYGLDIEDDLAAILPEEDKDKKIERGTRRKTAKDKHP